MLTILEILIILLNLSIILWPLLPIKKVPKFLDFIPLAAVVTLILHLFIDNEAVTLRFIPLYIFTISIFLMRIVKIFKHDPNQSKLKVLTIMGTIFQLGLLIVCVLIPTVVLPFHSLPEPTGIFNIGTVVMDFTDNSRVETLSKEDGVNRKIAVQFWYPSDKKGTEVKYDIKDAQISSKEEKFPLVIFSHGAFGMRMSNASTFRELASHGYIVASIDHSYQAFYTSFANGKFALVNQDFLNEAIGVQVDDITGQKALDTTHNWLDLRTADIELVIDSLKKGNLGASGEILKGHMELENIGLFGHSLGGAASAQVARQREDVKAAIVMDGTMIGDIIGLNSENGDIITDEKFTKPIMLMYGSLFQEEEAKATSYAPNIKAYKNAKNTAYSLCIKNSGHLNFTDLPRISPFLAAKLGVGSIDSFECIKIVNNYSLAFFDEHIKDQTSALLDRSIHSDQIEFEKRIPIKDEN